MYKTRASCGTPSKAMTKIILDLHNSGGEEHN